MIQRFTYNGKEIVPHSQLAQCAAMPIELPPEISEFCTKSGFVKMYLFRIVASLMLKPLMLSSRISDKFV